MLTKAQKLKQAIYLIEMGKHWKTIIELANDVDVDSGLRACMHFCLDAMTDVEMTDELGRLLQEYTTCNGELDETAINAMLSTIEDDLRSIKDFDVPNSVQH